MTDEHTWFRASLPAHLLGILPDLEEERFGLHARECEPCAALLRGAESGRDDWWEGADHLGVALLERWSRSPDSFESADRALVETHLSTCESCRRDLVDLAGSPEPDIVPRPVPGRTPKIRARWLDWITGGMIGALATAAFAVVWPAMRGHAPVPIETTSPTLTESTPKGAPAPTPAPAGQASAPLAARLRSIRFTEFTSEMRSIEEDAPSPVRDVVIGPRDTVVMLRFESPGSDPKAPVRVVIRDPHGSPVFTGPLNGADFDADHVLALEMARFTPGLWQAILVAPGAPPDSARYSFRIRLGR